jgi:hypothetical protein
MKVEAKAIKALEDFMDAAPLITPQAAALAMNTVIPRSGMARYKKKMRSEIAFPSGYLDDEEKFGVTRSASPSNLESVISARHRPTSLARFVTSGGSIGQEGLAVKVKANRTTRLRRAFLVRLRAGTALDSDNFNLGLAVRAPGGIRNKKTAANTVQLAKDVFLLYAPSVNQVFRAAAVTETPAVLNDIEAEFFRQFARLS